ncbi:RagB/SusD family nutrient uptake outer membrane protein [Zunongwangia endophytica]|uniref:RagB/SusD family nutrient uptake outer membrane protein n=1 Tax=Zunongwangia endophytica TaxID=1808945 RepID=A0ABV8H1P1_9FLAO|nr:RagB/SusD family nutrient uptake outer membrane protein [Zunongwangia endophytica]MDN3594427.1 RagB/SusD family nutrient uptake outer membrane protein [Zunongwangia endophytica]
MKSKLLLLLFIGFTIVSCDDLIEPAIENNRSLEDMYSEAEFAQGILLNGYTRLPNNNYTFSDVATDDAVSNVNDNPYREIATGQWTAQNNPFDQWQNANAAIQYLNIFLREADKVTWAEDEEVSEMFNNRLKGEAYGLRALFMYYLLRQHAGWANGELLGVPILLEPEETGSEFNQPRATFEACMQQLYADVGEAEALLPLDYETLSNLPEGYTDLADYNRVFGEYAKQRMTGRIAKTIRAKAALLAASPAYADGNSTTWTDVANYAGEVLAQNGGVDGIAENGHTWYKNDSQISSIGGGDNPPEIIWRTDVVQTSDLEQQHFPPTLFGDGQLNPSQNLVNSFPMANGYPISDPASGYDPSNPYTNRDPRLDHYVVVNQSTVGPNNSTIITAVDGTTNDALNAAETSTRTGFYLRKLLRQDVNLDPVINNTQQHYTARMRYTELYLIYAEAANEAWGPRGNGTVGFSAYDVISGIRERAGITQPDQYLETIGSDKNAMQELIRNERRLELCFEGFRFWDLRRWDSDLTVPAKGVSILNGSHETINVESRLYEEYMRYGPIPFSEVLKYDALVQNQGW